MPLTRTTRAVGAGLLLLGFLTGCTGLEADSPNKLSEDTRIASSPPATTSAVPVAPSATAMPPNPLAGLAITADGKGLTCQQITQQADCQEQIKRALAALPQLSPQLQAYFQAEMKKKPVPSDCVVTKEGQPPGGDNAVVEGFNEMLAGHAPHFQLTCPHKH